MSGENSKKESESRKRLFCSPKNGYLETKQKPADMYAFAEGYKAFLDFGKTERDCAAFIKKKAAARGFVPYVQGMALAPGDAVYADNRGKGIILARIGKRPAEGGVSVIASHIDAPRIDIRPVPVYEDGGMCYLKTHYYGGIKKYQWTALPLEMRGVVHTKDGKKVELSIGADREDPVFVITDILPHLAAEQMKKTMSEGIAGESLNILAGGKPSKSDEGGELVKLFVLELLYEQYGITEHDLRSAELSMVPAFGARDVGFDRSFVGAYGHDDRAMAYTSFKALFDMKKTPEKTALCVLCDKEEIGSEGVTGMQSEFFDAFIEELSGGKRYRCLGNSSCLSADVLNAFDPSYPEVSEKRNDAKMNGGVAIVKYTGHRGKSDASDASSEYMSAICALLERNKVLWQTGELGKVDQGGGGTVAKYMAKRNIDTIDVGVPVFSLHAPFEVLSKLDLYMAYKAFSAFYAE